MPPPRGYESPTSRQRGRSPEHLREDSGKDSRHERPLHANHQPPNGYERTSIPQHPLNRKNSLNEPTHEGGNRNRSEPKQHIQSTSNYHSSQPNERITPLNNNNWSNKPQGYPVNGDESGGEIAPSKPPRAAPLGIRQEGIDDDMVTVSAKYMCAYCSKELG